MGDYKHGEFCWYELGTRDIESALRFYTGLLGWTTVAHDMGEHGKYYIFQVDGQDVGGGYQMFGPMFEGVPPHWMPYVWVDDVDATAARITHLGGNVPVPAMDVPGVGRMAFATDPQGAHFSIFKGREHQGSARLSPKPGSFAWTELMTTDPQAARGFYSELFGWNHTEMPMGPGMTYTVFQLAGKPAAGMMKMEGPQFANVPPNWTSYISVAQCDESVSRASRLGAKVLVAPQDVPGTGRFSVLADPTGAVIAVIALQPM